MKQSSRVERARKMCKASLMSFVLCLVLIQCKELTQPCDCVETESISQVSAIDSDSFIIDLPEDEELEEIKIDYDDAKWSEIKDNDYFRLDLKYASTDNFTNKVIYNCSRCFLRPVAAERLKKVGIRVQLEKGWRVKLFDCYRPRPAQYKLWDLKPDATYVAHPDKGSMHNRGVAVDLTFTDNDGNDIDMGSPFDHFGPESRHTYTKLSKEIIENRTYLKTVMEEEGFNSIKSEWWHYSINGTGSALDNWEWACD